MATNLLLYGSACHTPPIPDTAALEIHGLCFTYPGRSHPALENIDLTVRSGERVALVGPNGAGKSTLIKLVVGLEKLAQGSIRIYGNPQTACYHRVALVPQRSEVDWRFPVSVREVVMTGRYVHLGWLKRPGKTDHEAVDRALDLMQIANLADRQVGELSGGQQQRVMLARTLAHNADLLLLDEPLNHVDVPTQELIFHVLEQLASEGRTIIISTHDLGILPIHFSRAIFIDQHIVADGPVTEVLTAETLAHAYGVELCTDEPQVTRDRVAG